MPRKQGRAVLAQHSVKSCLELLEARNSAAGAERRAGATASVVGEDTATRAALQLLQGNIRAALIQCSALALLQQKVPPEGLRGKYRGHCSEIHVTY